MARGGRTLLLGGCIAALCTTTVFGYGGYAARVITPIEPFAITSTGPQGYVVVCQFSDGQAARYAILGAGELGPLEPMFSPVGTGNAAGLAWCAPEEVLYWLVEEWNGGSRRYRLARTNMDGWALASGPQLQLPSDTVLGDMTYVPSLDAFVIVDAVADEYFAVARTTGLPTGLRFKSPVVHRDARICYGLGVSFVPVGPGYLDLLVGRLTDQRAMRVVRVDLSGKSVGVSYTLDIANDALRPGWPAGLTYVPAAEGHFTAVADTMRRRILMYSTPTYSAPGVLDLTGVITQTPIGPGATAERITAAFSWKNGGAYDSVLLELQDQATGEFIAAASAGAAQTTLTHDLGREGLATYRLTPSIGGEILPPALIHVQTAAGSLLSATALGSAQIPSSPFAMDFVSDPDPALYVAEITARSGETAAVVHRLRPQGGGGSLQQLTPISSPFGATHLTIGLAWNSAEKEIVWLGIAPGGAYVMARTTSSGAVLAAGLQLRRNPFLQDRLGDIAYDAATGEFWGTARNAGSLFSFTPSDNPLLPGFECTGVVLPLPSTLPDTQGTWGLPGGVSITQGAVNGARVFYVGMGRVAADAQFPAIGSGYVRRLVPLVMHSGGLRVAGIPVDMEQATESAMLRGLAVNLSGTPSVFVAAEDVGRVYEIRMYGEGPLFSRGDANADGSVNVADAVFVLEYLFGGGQEPPCLDAADVNDSGAVNISDGLTLLRHLFGLATETPIAAPFGICGTDPQADSVSCVAYAPCE